MKLKGKLVMLICLAMTVTSFSGCKNSEQTEETKKDVTLTWYMKGFGSTSLIQSHNDVEALKEIQNKTGIKLNFMDVVASSSSTQDEQLKLMIASGDYPDIMMWTFSSYPGGIPQLVREGVVLKVNDLVDKYAPNYKKILDDNPEVRKEIMDDSGTLAYFPGINLLKSEADKRRSTTTGWAMRKDWLDKVNKKVPTTIDEWYDVLKAFRDKDPNGDGATNDIPFEGGGLSMLQPAWGIRGTYYLNPKTKKVAYGPIQAEYKDYLSTMNRWYSEGLFGNNTVTATIDNKAVDTEILSDLVGTWKALDNSWTKYLPTLKTKNANAELVAVPWPIGPGGKAYTDASEVITHTNRETTVITTKCKYPEEAVKLMNFMYSQEGSDLLSWGVEGKSYTIENGKKKFIESVIKPAQGEPGLSKYCSPSQSYPKVGGFEASLSMYTPDQLKAEDVWGKVDTSLLLPPTLTFTPEENARINEINTQLGTYGVEMTNKFITGQESLANFDSYVQNLKRMGVDEILGIYQKAYERYNSRK